MASELMGIIYGDYGGHSDGFQPGGASFECGFVPHGVSYPEWKKAGETAPPEMRISEGAAAFMLRELPRFTITDWAWNSDKKHEHDPTMWDDLVAPQLDLLKKCRSSIRGSRVWDRWN
jgi:homogentisate 1,2-dioxygenase